MLNVEGNAELALLQHSAFSIQHSAPVPERCQRIDRCRAAGRDHARQERCDDERQRDRAECDRIDGADTKPHALHRAADEVGADKPSATPAPAAAIPSFTTWPTTRRRSAPSAMRKPISGVRCATRNDITP